MYVGARFEDVVAKVDGPHDALLVELLEEPKGFLAILAEHVHIVI
jgi:hypothetical protein